MLWYPTTSGLLVLTHLSHKCNISWYDSGFRMDLRLCLTELLCAKWDHLVLFYWIKSLSISMAMYYSSIETLLHIVYGTVFFLFVFFCLWPPSSSIIKSSKVYLFEACRMRQGFFKKSFLTNTDSVATSKQLPIKTPSRRHFWDKTLSNRIYVTRCWIWCVW